MEQLHVTFGWVSAKHENWFVLQLNALDQLFLAIHLHLDGGHRFFRPLKYGESCRDPTFNFTVIYTRSSYLFEDFAQQVLSSAIRYSPDLLFSGGKRLPFICVQKGAVLRNCDQSVA